MTGFNARVHSVVRRIPFGEVSTYGDIAALLAAPRAARGVGFALAALPEDTDVPWWRVINRRGEISLGHMPGRIQRVLLEKEGVRFGVDDRVDLQRYRWDGGQSFEF